MDPLAPRVPPRYVPVLTEIVKDVEPVAPAHAPPADRPVASTPSAATFLAAAVPPPAMSHASAAASMAPASQARASAHAQAPAAPSLQGLEDQLVHRVLQRIDVSLEQRLHDAVAGVVLQHTQSLGPRLREEIEFVVRQAVAEAVAHELAGPPAR